MMHVELEVLQQICSSLKPRRADAHRSQNPGFTEGRGKAFTDVRRTQFLLTFYRLGILSLFLS